MAAVSVYITIKPIQKPLNASKVKYRSGWEKKSMPCNRDNQLLLPQTFIIYFVTGVVNLAGSGLNFVLPAGDLNNPSRWGMALPETGFANRMAFQKTN